MVGDGWLGWDEFGDTKVVRLWWFGSGFGGGAGGDEGRKGMGRGG